MATKLTQRIQELEAAIEQHKHSELGMLLKELLTADFSRSTLQLIRQNDEQIRGKLQYIQRLSKLLGRDDLTTTE